MKDAERTAQQYDAIATSYAPANATGSANAGYERPATISLLGAVAGLRVLDAGCGPGALTSWLAEQGAEVTACDVSTGLLDIARTAAGPSVRFLTADLSEPLSFAGDGSFDLVVASLVMHYIRNWEPVLTEFHRVLVPDGAVVLSTHHPAMDWQDHSPEDYFAVKQVTEQWHVSGEGRDMTFWRRPLTAMTSAISAAGFVIEELVEAAPLQELQEMDPVQFTVFSTQPTFLHFRLRPR